MFSEPLRELADGPRREPSLGGEWARSVRRCAG